MSKTTLCQYHLFATLPHVGLRPSSPLTNTHVKCWSVHDDSSLFLPTATNPVKSVLLKIAHGRISQWHYRQHSTLLPVPVRRFVRFVYFLLHCQRRLSNISMKLPIAMHANAALFAMRSLALCAENPVNLHQQGHATTRDFNV